MMKRIFVATLIGVALVLAAHAQTTTDSSAAYSFKHLATGEYLVEAEATGFALAPAKSVMVERGQATTLDIALELSSLRSSVVVTASDTPQTVDEVSKALTVVNNQEIEE